jgi:hypothetical protein
MSGGHMRAVHDDLVELIECERPALLDGADRVERRVVRTDAGIELERDPHGLEPLAETGAQLLELEAVLGARERGAETAIGRLEHINDAGESFLRQQRAVKAALRRAAGVHALHHRAVLRGHQAGGLRAGDAECMHGVLGIEAQPARGSGSRREYADGGTRMPALADMLLAHALADPRADLVAGERRDQQFTAGEIGMALRHREQRRQRDGADMQHADAMHVIELEALYLGAVHQRGIGGG